MTYVSAGHIILTPTQPGRRGLFDRKEIEKGAKKNNKPTQPTTPPSLKKQQQQQQKPPTKTRTTKRSFCSS